MCIYINFFFTSENILWQLHQLHRSIVELALDTGNIHNIKFLQRVSLFFPSLKLKRQKEIGDPWPWNKMALSSTSLPCKHHSLLPLHTLVLSQLESCLLHVPTHKALPFIQMAWLDKALSTCRCRAAGAYWCNDSWWQQLALMSLVPDEASLCNGVVWL